MLVILQAIQDGAPGRRVQLRSDQVLKVGSSGWADFCVSGDRALRDVHFEVSCAPQGCVVRALGPDAPTLINGEPVTSAVAYDQDAILAGNTTFRLTIQGGPVRPADDAPAPPPQPAATSEPPSPSTAAATATAGAALGLVGVCTYLEFADDVGKMASQTDSADELIDALAAEEKFQDALKLRAYLMEKRQAVWWGCYCLRHELDEPPPPDQTAAVDAAADWVEDPTEARRRAAEAKAADAKYSGPGATLALSAFWSDGSLAPEGSPDVEPDQRLTSQGVTAALIAAAYLGDPTQASRRFQAFLQRGREVAQGEIPLPGDQ
jgi:hypothetical protein